MHHLGDILGPLGAMVGPKMARKTVQPRSPGGTKNPRGPKMARKTVQPRSPGGTKTAKGRQCKSSPCSIWFTSVKTTRKISCNSEDRQICLRVAMRKACAMLAPPTILHSLRQLLRRPCAMLAPTTLSNNNWLYTFPILYISFVRIMMT